MKLLIAFAAVLSSAALTIPTVTDVTEARSASTHQFAAVVAAKPRRAA